MSSPFTARSLRATDWKLLLADPRPHFPFPPIETKGSPCNCFCGRSCWRLPVPHPHCECRTSLDLTNGCLELEKSTSSASSRSFLPPVTFLSWRGLEVLTALSAPIGSHSPRKNSPKQLHPPFETRPGRSPSKVTQPNSGATLSSFLSLGRLVLILC